MIKRGLATHAELQTPEDYPVYCGMLAELLARTRDFDAGLQLLSSAETEAEKSGHRYWLAELHHRRARLLYEQGAPEGEVSAALVKSLEISSEQNAVALVLGAYDTFLRPGLFPEIVSCYHDRIDLAKSRLEPGEPLVVHPEEPVRRRSVVHSFC
jgi:predicted ATPase